MIVPDFWAEARIQGRIDGRQVTVKRFGWSETSQQDAQDNADARVKEAWGRIEAGEKLARSEPKLSYNGAEGVPIREQVLSRHGDAVVTRNIYGAQCLNTPDVLFVDIDVDGEPSEAAGIAVSVGLLLLAVAAAWLSGLWWSLVVSVPLVLGFSSVMERWRARRYRDQRDERYRQARSRVEEFLEQQGDWHLRLYRTPAGFRALAMHTTFDPRGDAASECFDALNADPLYVRMCRNQNCFRARLGPKPWRIGIESHIRPRPGVWPINPDKMPLRERWVADYERKAAGYAACEFVEALGATGSVDPKARELLQLHDELCRVDSGLPIA